MAFCGNCGTKVEDGKKFCPECGTVMEVKAQQPTQQAQQAQPQQQQQPQYQQPPQQAQPQMQYQQPTQAQPAPNTKGGADYTAQFDPADIEANKMMALLSYLIFFIPLLAAKESPYAKFHTNQGLLVCLAGIAVSIVGSIIPILGWFLILPVGCIIVAVIGIMGLINAWTGKAKELPIIGKIRIIK